VKHVSTNETPAPCDMVVSDGDAVIPAEAGDFVADGKGNLISEHSVVELPALAGFTRFRKSCFFDATVRYGVKGFVTYNHMLLPSTFRTVREEYDSLVNDVCLWDVGAQRQIQLVGPDAFTLAQMITPRNLKTMKIGDCRYAIITDERGCVLNDPIVIKVAEDRFWFSIADSDLLLWVKALALGKSLDVRVTEAEVSPVAVQGPKSVDLMRDLFGDWVDDLKYYKFKQTELAGMPMLVARSGWSPERGYELYLQDETRGEELWERIMEAGQKYNCMPGVPNQIRRIEGGMLSYGADIDGNHNVFELGLPKFMIDLEKEGGFIGQAALKRLVAGGGPTRKVVGLVFPKDGQMPGTVFKTWNVRDLGGHLVGSVGSACFSPLMDTSIAIATMEMHATTPGAEVMVQTGNGPLIAHVHELPFMKRM